MIQKTAFLDSLNPLLHNMLSEKFNIDVQPISELKDSLDSIDFYKLFFYTTRELEALDNQKTRFAIMVMRRKASCSTIEGVCNDDPRSYFNLYINYLNTVNAYQFNQYLEQAEIDKRNLLVKLLMLSKYSHDYEIQKTKTLLIECADTVREAIVEVHSSNIEHKPMWLYLFYYKIVTIIRDDPRKEWESLLLEIGSDSDALNNFYLNFLDPSREYEKFVKILSSVKHHVYSGVVNILSDTILSFLDNKTTIKVNSQTISLQRLYQDLIELKTYFLQFLASEHSCIKLLDTVIKRTKALIVRKTKNIKDALYILSRVNDLNKYRNSQLLPEEHRLLIKDSDNLSQLSERDLISCIKSSFKLIPLLSSVFVDEYLKQKCEDNRELVDVINLSNNYALKKILEEKILLHTKDVNILYELLSMREQHKIRSFLKESIHIKASSIDEKRLLLSLLESKSDILAVLSPKVNINQCVELAEYFDVVDQYFLKYRQVFLDKLNELQYERILKLMAASVKDKGYFLDLLRNFDGEAGGRDYLVLCGDLVIELIVRKCSVDATSWFYYEKIAELLGAEEELRAFIDNILSGLARHGLVKEIELREPGDAILPSEYTDYQGIVDRLVGYRTIIELYRHDIAELDISSVERLLFRLKTLQRNKDIGSVLKILVELTYCSSEKYIALNYHEKFEEITFTFKTKEIENLISIVEGILAFSAVAHKVLHHQEVSVQHISILNALYKNEAVFAIFSIDYKPDHNGRRAIRNGFVKLIEMLVKLEPKDLKRYDKVLSALGPTVVRVYKDALSSWSNNYSDISSSYKKTHVMYLEYITLLYATISAYNLYTTGAKKSAIDSHDMKIHVQSFVTHLNSIDNERTDLLLDIVKYLDKEYVPDNNMKVFSEIYKEFNSEIGVLFRRTMQIPAIKEYAVEVWKKYILAVQREESIATAMISAMNQQVNRSKSSSAESSRARGKGKAHMKQKTTNSAPK